MDWKDAEEVKLNRLYAKLHRSLKTQGRVQDVYEVSGLSHGIQVDIAHGERQSERESSLGSTDDLGFRCAEFEQPLGRLGDLALAAGSIGILPH